MNDRADFIDKLKDIFFKDLIDLGEFSDVAESKDCTFFSTLKHWVHVTLLNYVFTDDLCSCTTEDYA